METSTYMYTRSTYGTRLPTRTIERTESLEQHPESPTYYDLFLLIQDLLRSDNGIFLEFPIDEVGSGGISNTLGAGGFSTVSRKIANRRWGNRSVMAYKRVRPSFDSDGKIDEQGALRQVVDELKILSAASVRSHAHITRLRGISFEVQSHRKDGKLFPSLIFDASPFGSLLDFIRDPIRMVDGPYWECCMDVARGLQALHESGFIHGDVKCENVLVFPAANYEGRDFIAKLTDFGCSMTLDSIEPNTYTRLKGSTPPFDAPEADGMVYRDHLSFTDVYSYGILVWRVAIDGSDPFNHPRYRQPRPGDGEKRYDYALIRKEKGTENVLSIALNEVLDPALGLSPNTAAAFCEVLSIALSSDPTQRDLGHILEAIERNTGNFQKRTFGLSPSSARFLRESTKNENKQMLGVSRTRYGLAQWRSIPPKAHHLYHTLHQYGTIDSDFRGFGLSRLPPVPEAIRDLLLAVESVYLSCGRSVPPIGADFQMTASDSVREFKDALDRSGSILKTAVKDALAVAASCMEITSYLAILTKIRNALNRLSFLLSSMGSLFGSAVGSKPKSSSDASMMTRDTRSHQELFDRPGGLADRDRVAMMNESTQLKPPFVVSKPSSHLDFYLLSTCRLPFSLQQQLFTDISSRAKKIMGDTKERLVAMEEAICYSLGFGVEQDYVKYLAIVEECCLVGHRPAQESLQRLYDALGFPLPEDVLSSPWFSKEARNGLLPSPDTTHTISSIRPLVSDGSSNHDPTVYGSFTNIEGTLSINPSQVNNKNDDGDTPLMIACRAGNLPITDFLIEHGADCSIKNNLGESPIHWIWTFGTSSLPNIVSRMISKGADLNTIANESPSLDPHEPYPLVGGTALHRAVARGNKGAVQELIRNGASVFQRGGPAFYHKGCRSNLDPIQLACTWHEPEILEILLDSAPLYPMNAEMDNDLGLLGFAIQCQSTHHRMARHGSDLYTRFQETIDLLLKRGCTNVVDKDGLTALQLAVCSDSAEILEYILTANTFAADINVIVGDKSTIQLAISKGKLSIFELLVRNGADVFQPSTTGHVLSFAIRSAPGNEYFARRMLTLGGQLINQIDRNTAFATAFQEGQWKLADFLLGEGADINGFTHNSKLIGMECTVFGELLVHGSVGRIIEGLELIESLTAKHNQKPHFIICPDLRESALHAVVGSPTAHDKHEHARLYSLTLAMFPRKSHLEARNLKGYTPLHMAILARNEVAVRALLDAGADVNSLALYEGSPVGPSVKDLLFAQLFARAGHYDINDGHRNEGDRALERIFKIFLEEPVSGIAKRSVTIRAERRQHMSQRDRKVANFVEVLSLLPEELPRPEAVMPKMLEAMRVGSEKEFLRSFELEPLDIARRTQWVGLGSIHFLRHEGAGILKAMGLLDAYLCW